MARARAAVVAVAPGVAGAVRGEKQEREQQGRWEQ
jgi:hypothetical protein